MLRLTDTPDDDPTGKTSPLVSPVVRAFRLLRYVADGGATSNLSEVGRLIDVNRVTVMRLIATLEHEGILEALPQGGHQIGLEFLKLASATVAADDLLGLGQRVLAEVRQALNLSAYLAALDGPNVVYLLRDMPESGLVSSVKVGSRVPAHLTTPGRVLLAQITPADLRELLGAEPLASATAKSPDKYANLEAILDADRRRGCAWSFSGFELGINSCAAPVFDVQGKAVAAISVAGPETSFKQAPELQERAEQVVKAAAFDLSALLGNRRTVEIA